MLEISQEILKSTFLGLIQSDTYHSINPGHSSAFPITLTAYFPPSLLIPTPKYLNSPTNSNFLHQSYNFDPAIIIPITIALALYM